MKNTVLVKRYADALMSVAKSRGRTEDLLESIKFLRAQVLALHADFLVTLQDPGISVLEKRQLIDAVLADGDAVVLLRNFMKLLVARGRINLLHDICEWVRIHYAHVGEEDALLRTSFPLDLDVVKAIKDRLERMFNKKLHLYIELDGTLRGGVKAMVGNTIIDGSVARRLTDLRERLISTRVSNDTAT